MTHDHTITDAFSARIPAGGLVTAPTPFLSARSALAQIGGLFTRLYDLLIAIAEADPRVRRVEALQAKTDAELSDMGLTRDQIGPYVFRDCYYL